MTAFGHRIAIACDDGTVAIHDSFTGVLGLSLRPADPVHAMRGSKDGSILFCTHQTPSVTSWDIQTGGLIHTFFPEGNLEDMAISSKARLLACALSNGTVKVWEVATRTEYATLRSGGLDTRLCWSELGDQLAVTKGPSVRICDIAPGKVKVLRRFKLQYPTVCGMIHSLVIGRFIVVTTSPTGSAVDILDPLGGSRNTGGRNQRRITCFTLSQATDQLVCGTETHGLELFSFSTWQWRQFEYPVIAKFVSSLPNGTVVTNFGSSGVQVLSLDHQHPTSQQPTISALTVHPFDKGGIIAVLPTSRSCITLLEPATMSHLLTIPIRKIHTIPVDRTHILCASLDKHMTVYSFEKRDKEYLELWAFHDEHPTWTVEIGGLPSAGGISPTGTRLVTFYDVDDQTCVSVLDTQHGQLQAQLRINHAHPLAITFDSETQFYSHHDTYRVPYVVSPSESEDRSHSLRGLLNIGSSATLSHQIACRERLPLIGESRRRNYDVDETREWVVSGSERICWIPLEYIGSVQPSHCWIGCSLVMAGQDGILRKLTFRESV